MLAEEALKIRIDGKQKEQEHSYKREMQYIVLAITLSYKQYGRSYKHLTDWIRKSIREEGQALKFTKSCERTNQLYYDTHAKIYR